MGSVLVWIAALALLSLALALTVRRYRRRAYRRAQLRALGPLFVTLTLLLALLDALLPPVGRWVAFGAGALFLLAAVLGGHALRRLRADLADVADPERRAAALERLHAYVAAREAKRATRAQFVAIELLDRRQHEAARAFFEAMEGPRLSPLQRATRELGLVVVALREGDLDEGRRRLDELPTTDHPSVRSIVQQLRAALLALAGDGARALEMLEGARCPAQSGAAWDQRDLLVRAHAYAALGREREGREALEAFLARWGVDALALAVHQPAGPATPLADALLRGASAYR